MVGNGLTPELVTDFACAFGTYLDGCEAILARDTRRSSPMLMQAASSALVSAGCTVTNAGICPTPVAQYLVRQPPQPWLPDAALPTLVPIPDPPETCLPAASLV